MTLFKTLKGDNSTKLSVKSKSIVSNSDTLVNLPGMVYLRGSQPGVHLAIRSGTFKVSNRRENVFACYFYKYLYIYQ